jgi:hypothetical protein
MDFIRKRKTKYGLHTHILCFIVIYLFTVGLCGKANEDVMRIRFTNPHTFHKYTTDHSWATQDQKRAL